MLDYLIVGHGLAGAVLSRFLEKKGNSYHVLDQVGGAKSSIVAGGLYNPITGRKMTTTWQAASIFPQIEPFYTDFEEMLNTRVLNKIGVYRPFISIEEQNDWQARMTNPKYAPFIRSISNYPNNDHNLNDPYGGLYLNMAGWVDVKKLLNANKNHLSGKGRYSEMLFNMQRLESQKDNFTYNDFQFRRLIICTGYADGKIPFFDWLPFKPVKGELLSISLKNQISTIYNRGVFVLPFDDQKCKLGATYNWKDVNCETSDAAKRELKDKLEALYTGQYRIIDQVAGIRPATKDRRPFIGEHPESKGIYIFNGFGSKGVSMAPYFGKQFVEFLEDDNPLENEVNVNRYFSLYYNKEHQSNG